MEIMNENEELILIQKKILAKTSSISGWVTIFGIIGIIAICIRLFNALLSAGL